MGLGLYIRDRLLNRPRKCKTPGCQRTVNWGQPYCCRCDARADVPWAFSFGPSPIEHRNHRVGSQQIWHFGKATLLVTRTFRSSYKLKCLCFTIGGENNLVGFSVGIPPFYLHASFDHRSRWKWMQRFKFLMNTLYSGIETGISYDEGAIQVSFMDPVFYVGPKKKWMSWCFRPADFLFGRAKYRPETLSEHEVEIPMPEGPYPATVKFTRATWKRKRLPWAKALMVATVETHKPIPYPTNEDADLGWDRDKDMVYSMSFTATTLPAAISAVVEVILRDRERYGGSVSWRPNEPDQVSA